MDLMLSPEEEQIGDMARSLLSKELPVDHLRWQGGAVAARDRALLPHFAELGWLGLGLPEIDGGAGFGATEEVVLFRELGRALVTPLMLLTVIATRLAASLGDKHTTAALLAGKSRVGLAISAGAAHNLYLIDAADADRLLVVLNDRLLLVPAAAITERAEIRGMDGTVTFERGLIGSSSSAPAADAAGQASLRRYLSLLIAAMLVGAAEAVRDLAVEHAKVRTQFGQKIGTFQAVSHPCAEMAVRCEAALSQMKVAAITLRDGRVDADFQVTAARIVALDAVLANAAAGIQLYGGPGFAAEYPIHFFLKRAHLLDQVGGCLAQQLDAIFDSQISP
jgi:alkylation response protein AidB-like acyl-CoA dehydrogenase